MITEETIQPRTPTTLAGVDKAILSRFCEELGFDPSTVIRIAAVPERVVVETYKLDDKGRPTINKDPESGAIETETELHVRTVHSI